MTVDYSKVIVDDHIVVEEIERKPVAEKDLQEAAKILKELERVSKEQYHKGYGNASKAVELKKQELVKLKEAAKANDMAEKFKAVKEPHRQYFPRFSLMGGSVANHETRMKFEEPPLLAAVLLSRDVEVIYAGKGAWEGGWEAPVPVIPESAQFAMDRAREIAGNCDFWMLFMPAWSYTEQKDPVILAHLPLVNEWFKVSEWLGDVDLIKEFLESK